MSLVHYSWNNIVSCSLRIPHLHFFFMERLMQGFHLHMHYLFSQNERKNYYQKYKFLILQYWQFRYTNKLSHWHTIQIFYKLTSMIKIKLRLMYFCYNTVFTVKKKEKKRIYISFYFQLVTLWKRKNIENSNILRSVVKIKKMLFSITT